MSSSLRPRLISSTSAVSVWRTNRREIVERLVDFACSTTYLPTGSAARACRRVATRGQRGVPTQVRVRVFERDGHTCQLRYAGCTVDATEIDDIIPVSPWSQAPSGMTPRSFYGYREGSPERLVKRLIGMSFTSCRAAVRPKSCAAVGFGYSDIRAANSEV